MDTLLPCLPWSAGRPGGHRRRSLRRRPWCRGLAPPTVLRRGTSPPAPGAGEAYSQQLTEGRLWFQTPHSAARAASAEVEHNQNGETGDPSGIDQRRAHWIPTIMIVLHFGEEPLATEWGVRNHGRPSVSRWE